jgi:hypothetical protein
MQLNPYYILISIMADLMCWRQLMGTNFSFMGRWYIIWREELCPLTRATHQMPSTSIGNASSGRFLSSVLTAFNSLH